METQAYRGPRISVFIRQESLTAVTDDSKISVALTQCKCISYFWHRLIGGGGGVWLYIVLQESPVLPLVMPLLSAQRPLHEPVGGE